MHRRTLVLLLCIAITALALATPVGRIFRRTELSYNEGWNVAAAMRLAPDAAHNPQLPHTNGASPLVSGCCQAQLYPAGWGWTSVNYPVLSFALFAALHSATRDYLFTARIVSLLALFASAFLLARIARALGAGPRATLLTGLLCVATFAVCAVDYTGVDDPQMLGDSCFLLALFVYVRHRRGGAAEPPWAAVLSAAALFVVAGCVKQSPIDFPIAVLLDLLLLSRKKAAAFVAAGTVFGVAAVVVNRAVGGPWFVQQQLLGRVYSAGKAWQVAASVLGPMLLPVLLAGYTAWQLRHDRRRRIAGLLLVTSVGVGGYFGGGSGVAGNALFTALFAVVLLVGLAFGRVQHLPRLGPALPVAAFAWLLTPALVQSVANPAANLRNAAASEARFASATRLLQSHPGPALCESILLCLQSGKPYIYDPFNATRLLLQGRLSQGALLSGIAAHRYSAIQLHAPATASDALFLERFPQPVLDAIDRSYSPVLHTEDAVVYLPRDTAPQTH